MLHDVAWLCSKLKASKTYGVFFIVKQHDSKWWLLAYTYLDHLLTVSSNSRQNSIAEDTLYHIQEGTCS